MNPWAQLLGNPASYQVKKYLFDVLKERYTKNEDFIDRLATQMTTPKDIEGLGRFVVDIYEIAYLKSVQDHQQVLQQKGFVANVVPDLPPELVRKHRIFAHPEKEG